MKTVLLEHNTVWGVNSRDEIYFKSHPDDPVWQRIEGALKQVEVSQMGNIQDLKGLNYCLLN